MDINLLVLNAGNSRLAIGVFSGGELIGVERILNDQRDQWPAKIREAWGRIAEMESPAVVGATVNPPLIEPLEHLVQEICGQEMQWVGRGIDFPIAVKVDEPKQVGVDRVLNVAAAYEQLGKACIVVDAGTAVTVDFCNDAGEFLGGAISPGVNLMLSSLHEKTARLPLVEFKTPEDLYGKNTASALCHGVYQSIRGLVREASENYASTLGTWPEVIATGGDAEALFKDWELIHAISPDLTIYGIALAYTEHQIRNS